MSARVCRSCDYNVVSTVVTACPHCGEPLPRPLASSGALSFVGIALILALGGGAMVVMRDPGRWLPVAPTTTFAPLVTRPPAARATPAVRATPAAGKTDDAQVAKLVALLDDPTEGYQAALTLSKMDTPRARQALMAAYDRRDYGKMVGAAGFYARTRPPGYEKTLITLLHESRDLAVAQDLILSRDPKLAGPATKWAAEQGFKLVKSSETPTGVTWTAVSNPGQ